MKLLHRRWRHHGLGMLQSEVTDNLRIHVWHPSLRAEWYFADPFRCVHDHRFDLRSTVLFGCITDVLWNVSPRPAGRGNTKVWSVVHAKEQHRNPQTRGTEYLYDANAYVSRETEIHAGGSYSVARRQFHTTKVTDLAITLVSRDNFDSEPARVLGAEAEPGIVAFGAHGGHANVPGVAGAEPTSALWEEVLKLAERASEGIDL